MFKLWDQRRSHEPFVNIKLAEWYCNDGIIVNYKDISQSWIATVDVLPDIWSHTPMLSGMHMMLLRILSLPRECSLSADSPLLKWLRSNRHQKATNKIPYTKSFYRVRKNRINWICNFCMHSEDMEISIL